jgi:ribosome-associated protein
MSRRRSDGDLRVSPRLTIPAAELRESFARSGGPGGQNVNKVSSKVELRWKPGESAALSATDRAWLLSRLARRLTTAGDLVVRSTRTRDQLQNRADARDQLVAVLRTALVRPRKRIATRPGKGAVERRLAGKKRRAEVKKQRLRRPDD